MSTVALIGNPRPASRTAAAALRVVNALTHHAPDEVIELADFGTDLLEPHSARVEDALEVVREADLLVVASPTYKGTYTGLLKLFLDRLGRQELASTTAIPVMLGATPAHSLAPEVFLKPLLAELGAKTPTRGLFLVESEGIDSVPFAEWVAGARDALEVVRPTALAGVGA